MTYPVTIRELNEHFEHRTNELDTWTPISYVPHASHPDRALIGDSVSYAMTVLFIQAGFSWWRLLWMILTGGATFYDRYPRSYKNPDTALFVFGRGYISHHEMIFHRENGSALVFALPRLYVFAKMLMGVYTRRMIRKRGF